MRYLHEELFATTPAQVIMRETDEEIRERGRRSDPDNPQVAETIVGLRHWLLDGRRIVLLSPLTVEALMGSPEAEALFGPARCVEVMLERPMPSKRRYRRTGDGIGMITEDGDGESALAFAGFFLLSDGDLGFLRVVLMHWDGRQSWCSTTTGPDLWSATGDMEAQIVSAALRALTDERTAWIDPAPARNKARAKRERAAGLNIGRLVLAEDALAVWRRRHLAEHERAAPAELVTRGPVSPHEVRPHMCRVWVLEPGLGEDIEADKLHRPAKDGEPAVWLYCVSRPRRGHIHGRGEVRAKVERVVPCL